MLGYDDGAAKTADDLRTEVLAPPAHGRARIASDLLASLDHEAADETEVDELWSAETRRATMLDTGGRARSPGARSSIGSRSADPDATPPAVACTALASWKALRVAEQRLSSATVSAERHQTC